jgi:hypothetical protein
MRDPDRDAFEERDRRETNKLLARMRDMRESWAAAAEPPLTPEERLANFVEILQEEFDKRGTPPPVPIGRVGVSGVDRLAQRLLGERGVQTLHSATPQQYRRAVREVLDGLENGQLSPSDIRYRETIGYRR